MPKSIMEHEGKKYLRLIHSATGVALDDKGHPCVSVDVYAVLEAFGVTCPARAHAIKKLLCCGNRSKGSELDDLLGAEAAVARAINLQQLRDAHNSGGTNDTVSTG